MPDWLLSSSRTGCLVVVEVVMGARVGRGEPGTLTNGIGVGDTGESPANIMVRIISVVLATKLYLWDY